MLLNISGSLVFSQFKFNILECDTQQQD